MNKLSSSKRAEILSMLSDGSSVRAVSRCCGVSTTSVLRLLSDAGSLAAEYHDLMVRGLATKRAEGDEMWGFVSAKEKAKKRGASGHGDAWLWAVIDADSKILISYRVGDRDSANAHALMHDLRSRVTGRIQLTTDSLASYPAAVEAAFGSEIDFATLHKQYETDQEAERRYSPAKCTGVVRKVVQGNPDPAYISTSYIERSNLSVRTSMKRLSRLTIAFSKSLENHKHAIALNVFGYNFVRIHRTLKTTPAVAAGVAQEPMSWADFVAIMEKEERIRGGRLTDYLSAV